MVVEITQIGIQVRIFDSLEKQLMLTLNLVEPTLEILREWDQHCYSLPTDTRSRSSGRSSTAPLYHSSTSSVSPTNLPIFYIPLTYRADVETAGRTLEDIDNYFRDHDNIFVHRDELATSSKRPLAYIEKENAEIRRASSVNPHAMSLAVRHRRMSAMDAANMSVGDDTTEEKGLATYKEEV